MKKNKEQVKLEAHMVCDEGGSVEGFVYQEVNQMLNRILPFYPNHHHSSRSTTHRLTVLISKSNCNSWTQQTYNQNADQSIRILLYHLIIMTPE
jgi:hypothetical protein